MGFLSSLFGKGNSNIGMEYVKKYGPLMLEPVCGDMPKQTVREMQLPILHASKYPELRTST